MQPIYIDFLNRLDIEALAITDDEILEAIETSLATQGRDEAVIEPRVHFEPGVACGHFNVLRGALKAPIDLAGVKMVGDFVDNYTLGLPSELAILLLLDPRTGIPKAILDASGITDMRTGAVTAIGAAHLARKPSKILGRIGAHWKGCVEAADIMVEASRPWSCRSPTSWPKSWSMTGASAVAASSAACVPMSRLAGCPRRHCMPSSARGFALPDRMGSA